MSPWLSVVGVGEDGVPGLSSAARTLILTAEVLVGERRHLDMVPEATGERLIWAAPLADVIARLLAKRGRKVCVLTGGDPSWFGIGSLLGRVVDPAEMTVLPHVSAFSYAAARLGWALQDCAITATAGRPLENLLLLLAPGRKVLIQSENGLSPQQIGQFVTQKGYGPSPMTVIENGGGPGQKLRTGYAESWRAVCGDLNVVALDCQAVPGVHPPPLVPGLPDDCFVTDGQMTRREVRAATLAALGPYPGAMLWDLGAGSGSVAIEWMRAGGKAIAVEAQLERTQMIATNAARLGVPELDIRRGDIAEIMAELDEVPDAIFLGGAVSAPGLLKTCWDRLRPGGRLVSNSVTSEGEAALLAFQDRYDGDLIRFAISRLRPTGRYNTWHPFMPVTQYAVTKPLPTH